MHPVPKIQVSQSVVLFLLDLLVILLVKPCEPNQVDGSEPNASFVEEFNNPGTNFLQFYQEDLYTESPIFRINIEYTRGNISAPQRRATLILGIPSGEGGCMVQSALDNKGDNEMCNKRYHILDTPPITRDPTGTYEL
ncbi:hypothetical protein FIBSPDRAFT_887201 [Athelia psychrophila]|uniref:Uncharacterized protein n=1 Tax=Athelia psychrophila TaxID=1759441 RepID=A0A166Q3I3_9AGAM|nr:hypothetical protein FIBSPDRAFT_887201 [Fibularhizoctonia sp. CBS 109695]